MRMCVLVGHRERQPRMILAKRSTVITLTSAPEACSPKAASVTIPVTYTVALYSFDIVVGSARI